MTIWNPWHGCHKISEGCLHCYMFRRDESIGKDGTLVTRTTSFNAPVRRKRGGEYAMLEGGTVYACMTSDFFLEEADPWREEAWRFIRERQDLQFTIITKRIHRFEVALPPDWGRGYENVTICATCENQKRADERLPLLLDLPIRRRQIIHEPMLERIDIEPYLQSGKIKRVICGGESGPDARLCRYEWILNSRDQCARTKTSFSFKQTGARFAKGERFYVIPRRDQIPQARRAGIDLEY